MQGEFCLEVHPFARTITAFNHILFYWMFSDIGQSVVLKRILLTANLRLVFIIGLVVLTMLFVSSVLLTNAVLACVTVDSHTCSE